jgi:hypothetical protein
VTSTAAGPLTKQVQNRSQRPAHELLQRLIVTQQTIRNHRHVDNNPYADVCTIDCNLAWLSPPIAASAQLDT